MKRKSLLALSSIGLLTLSSWFAFSGEEKVSAYTPREQRLEGTYNESLPYMKKLRGNIETGEFQSSDYHEVAQAVAEHDRNHSNRALNLSWWEMGPDNVGGRTRAILAVTDQLIFAGSVTGGLFKSTNAGNSWTRVVSLDAIGKTMAISCIDQTEDGTIYLGTGSVFESGFDGSGASGSIGVGLYRSTDLGENWELVPGTDPAAFNGGDDWAYINDICADANDPAKIWIASNSGTGWWKPGESAPDMTNSGLPSTTGQDVEWAEDGSYCLVVAANGNIYRSTDGGGTFDEISVNGMSGNRALVAISVDDPNVCYALYTSGGVMGGLFYSNNKGDSWTEVWPSGVDDTYNVFNTGQGYYDLALTVKPGEPDIAWLAGVTLWKSGNGTQPEQIAYNFGFGGMDTYVHSDIHTFEIAPNGDWYIGSDGGVSKSTDGGLTFTTMNRGYNVTQFYGIAHSGGYPVMGGSQDNGTQVILGTDNGFFDVITDQQAFEIMGGDGFDCEMSQTTMGAIMTFSSSYYGVISRFDQTGTGGGFYDNDILLLTDPAAELGLGLGIFHTPMRLFEDTDDPDSQQYIWALNPTNHNISDTTITLYTDNLHLPFEYTLGEDDTLHFWPTLVRPAFSSEILYTMDPNYPWLEAQDYTSEEDCDTTLTQIGSEMGEVYDSTFTTVFWSDSVFVTEINDWVYFEDSIEVLVDVDTTIEEIPIYDVDITCVTTYNYIADALENVKEQRLVQDTYTSLFTTAFTGTDGIWITRQALNTNVTPDWWRIGMPSTVPDSLDQYVFDAPGSGVKAMEFTQDGNTLWISSWSGGLWRITGLDDCYSADYAARHLQIDQVITSGPVITSIASDPNDIDHVVITIGGYGTAGAGKVRETDNAMASDPGDIDWNNIWDFEDPNMEKMPIYSSIIHVENPNIIVVGTEFGVYASDDGGDSWTHCDNIATNDPNGPSVGKLSYVPVFDLRQQKVAIRRFMDTDNFGVIYAGTHGRGIFRSSDLFNSVEEVSSNTSGASLLIYPNPATDQAYINVELSQPARNVAILVYDINGKLVRTINRGFLSSGSHKISLEAELLPTGNYIVSLEAGATRSVGKFIKVN